MPEITEFLLDLRAQVLNLRLQGLILLSENMLLYNWIFIFQFPLSQKKLTLVANFDTCDFEFFIDCKKIKQNEIETTLLQH